MANSSNSKLIWRRRDGRRRPWPWRSNSNTNSITTTEMTKIEEKGEGIPTEKISRLSNSSSSSLSSSSSSLLIHNTANVVKLVLLLLPFFAVTSYLPSMHVDAIQFPSSSASSSSSQSQQQPSSNAKSPSASIRSVSTPFGVVRGQLVAPVGTPLADVQLAPVIQFLAIPYGSAPIGHHRFKMPISAPKWAHQPKDAFRPPPACIQSGLPALSESEALKVTTAQRFDRLHRILPRLKPQSEDCLFMNLFVPERRELRDAQPLSVLVLVHGDTDYGWGGANAHNGTLLASFGRIVVVTVNYRLGVYGFLGRCDPEALQSCAGNAGLSDLVAALKMLSLLLPSFGADPNAVTLLGWESGAALVSLLMASPITQPKGRLFRRAILLDGSAVAPWAMADNPQEQFMRLANELKCLGGANGNANNAGGGGGDGPPNANNGGIPSDQQKQQPFFQKEATQILHCIQDQSAQNLSAAARKIAHNSPTFLSAFAPIIDGQMVPNHPSLSFSPKYGALFREIDLLVGTVQHPAQHLMADQDMQHGIGPERRDKIIRTLVRNIFDFHRTEILQAILNEYMDWENPRNHPKSIRNGLMAALSDLLFTTPLIETARAHSMEEGGSPMKMANTFFFVFAHETSGWMREQPNSGLRGSFTGDHLPYLLGHPFTTGAQDDGNGQNNGAQFSPEDKQLCRVMMTFLANFVKSGDPTRPQPMLAQSSIEDRYQGLPWPQFSAQTREAYLEISDRPRVKNFYRNAQVQFWSGFIPVLNRRTGKDVPEEHHFLPDHFDRSTFFGEPRPFSTFHNIPFPPPPMPPSPFPKDLRKQLIASLTLTTKRPPTAGSSSAESTQKPPAASSGSAEGGMGTTLRAEYNPNWGWLILVGVALTLVNLCILVAISRKCLRRRSESKKKFQYQSYASPPGHIPPPGSAGLDMNFAAMLSGQQQSSRRSSQFMPATPRPISSTTISKTTRPTLDTGLGDSIGTAAEEFVLLGTADKIPPMSTENNGVGATGNNNSALAMALADRRRRTSLVLQRRTAIATTTTAMGTIVGEGDGGGIAARTSSISGAGTFGGHSFGGPGRTSVDSSAGLPEADRGLPPILTPRIMMMGGNEAGGTANKRPSWAIANGQRHGNNNNGEGDETTGDIIGTNAHGQNHQHQQQQQQQQQRQYFYSRDSGNFMSTSQRSSLHEQQEPLLSAAGSLKGSTPSMMIQTSAPPGGGLIRVGTGISPTCPRHGRAAQMLMAANRAGGGVGGGGVMQQQQQLPPSNGNGGGQHQQQQQQQTGLEEVQV